MRSAFDWVSRVIMLVLAGLVSLSIIGALASISSGGMETRTGVHRTAGPVPEAGEPAAAPEPQASQPRRGGQEDAGFATGEQVYGQAPPEPSGPARWLEAIAYALLALAGIAAFGVLLLWRALAEQRRIADALEALARQP